MRCSKSCYLRDLELVDLFDNEVIEQVYYMHILTSLRMCVKSQSKVETFFLTFYWSAG